MSFKVGEVVVIDDKIFAEEGCDAALGVVIRNIKSAEPYPYLVQVYSHEQDKWEAHRFEKTELRRTGTFLHDSIVSDIEGFWRVPNSPLVSVLSSDDIEVSYPEDRNKLLKKQFEKQYQDFLGDYLFKLELKLGDKVDS